MDPLSVLIVDDSSLMRNAIRRIVESDDELAVADVAVNGLFALQKIPKLRPDVVVLDLEMPEMDGIAFLEERRNRKIDVPVIILSSIAKKGASITMKALSLGAVDFITKTPGAPEDPGRPMGEHLKELIKAYGRDYRRRKGSAPPEEDAGPAAPRRPVSAVVERERRSWPKITPKASPVRPEVLAIGVSTGGPYALRRIFSDLRSTLPFPILVVQHMPAGFTSEFAASLHRACPLEVKEAADGDVVKPGRVLVAPGDRHLTVEKRRLAAVARLDDGEVVNGHKPSVGVLFDSVAENYGNAAAALIMTGMGKDGAREIGNVFAEGGTTIAQDEASSVVYGMPRVAVEHGYIGSVVGLKELAGAINALGTSARR